MRTRSTAAVFAPGAVARAAAGCAALAFAAGVHAQAASEGVLQGIRLQPAATAVIELPVYGNWGIRSTASGFGLNTSDAMRFGLAGSYGWQFSENARLAFSAGLVNVERAVVLPGMAVGMSRLRLGGGAFGMDARDLSFNLALDWRYSNALTLYTGLDISYSLVDPTPIGLQGVMRPGGSSAGFVGLKYRF